MTALASYAGIDRVAVRGVGRVTSAGIAAIDYDLCGDRVLICRYVSAHDHAAFTALVRRHAPLVTGVCRRILSSIADADDAFQATFMVLARRASSLTWNESIAGWLHETARRTALRLRASTARRRRAEDEAAAAHRDRRGASSGDGPVHQASVRELASIIDTELARLPTRFREVILLNQVEGLSRDEAAQRLGISVAAVKDRLERGRQQLSSRLARRGINVSAAAAAAWLVPGAAKAATLSTLALSTTEAATSFAAGGVASAPATVAAAASLAQGVLKMLGLEKLKLFVIALVTVLTAGSIAYGVLRDDPQRFEKGLRGDVVALTNGSAGRTVTVKLEDFDTLLNLDISKDAKVSIAYETGKLEDLKEGQYVSLRLGPDHRVVNEIHIRGEQKEVVVTAVDPAGKITATPADAEEEEDENGNKKPIPKTEFKLADGAIFRLGGLPAALTDIKPGMKIPVELSPAGDKVNAVEVDIEENLLKSGSVVQVEGRTVKIRVDGDDDPPSQDENGNDLTDEQRHAIEVKNAHPYTLASEAKVMLDSKPAQLADIKPGSDITLRLSEEGGTTVKAVKATTVKQEE
jgi:RNA polymerase sigma factor (sigma-70 family)